MRDDLMVQEQVRSVWQHMVGVICLNQTGRKKVKKILPEFFKKFPDEFELLKSNKETIAEMLKDLGMKNVRAHRIWRMTEEYLEWDGGDATELFGIGKYGSDSYEIFYNYHCRTCRYQITLLRLYHPTRDSPPSFSIFYLL